MNLTPRNKLLLALAALALLPLAGALHGQSGATIARVVLALCAVGGMAWWLLRARTSGGTSYRNAPRLKVVQRVGLSARSGLALVEIDGRPYVVVHGEGFARLRPTHRPRPALRLVHSEEAAS